MIRYTIAVAGEPRQGSPPATFEEEVVDIFSQKQLEESFLCDVNRKGQVPVLASTSFDIPITDSLDMTLFLAERHPDLLPTDHREQSQSLLRDLHAINYFSLTFGDRPEMAAGNMRAIDQLLGHSDLSGRYREALLTLNEKQRALEPEAAQRNRAAALDLMTTLAGHLSGRGPWLFGYDHPSALDAHLVVFIARMQDVGQDELIPDALKAYARTACATPEYMTIMDGRRTIPSK
ncbi:hypothetical protein LTR10_015623 [Elasticomyces elasticus]|uniref:GST N-terminal domain-containing protein n=1 Tax=Exophiala sideris TaxID=1016849 RepID=A0ABR0JL67_9EURO|nr:hypothetical protein LTR10_015623 [Elasticomyces elasticus]KAK5036332.1 hypothetical protein LTS07_002059 [Exophiala sideris]KAK5041836.1 hypothetical protein LTR13_002503 [Exophiala sideris]KAK5066716.1 hypothetical protein LTR69_002063 [Exophiala sideris]KAK5184774.1 hypothetical protein LTR44_002620 [Eurotiomycetes sp. CCFEE 6388]